MYLYNTEKLSKTAQKKILKVINDREILVEGEASVPADLRFLFSFGLPLIEIMKRDTMLPEFIQRVSVLSIQMPELNDRRQDILPLISYLLSEANGGENSLEYAVSSVGAEMLERYDWPGGGAQLLELVEKKLLPNRDKFISADALPSEIFDQSALENPMHDSKGPHAYRGLIEFLHEYEESVMSRLEHIPLKI